MRKSMTLAGLGGALLALVAFGDARAQTEPVEVKALDTGAPEPAAKKAPAVMPDVIEQVPDAEKPAKSQEHIARMREILTKVLKHLEEARDEKDIVKLNCVNEKLTNIKGLLKISEDGDVKMQEALARRAAEDAAHEYEKIAIARSKCEQLFAESEACVGELAVYAGDTQVEVVVEGEPPDDLADNIPPVDIIVRPPAASPYQ
jgi:hypothetical protein